MTKRTTFIMYMDDKSTCQNKGANGLLHTSVSNLKYGQIDTV